MNQRFRSYAFATGILLVLAAGSPTLAQTLDGDSLYREVVSLLEGDISDSVILSWLATQGDLPPLSARQILLLKDAGASERLLQAVLGADVTPDAQSRPSPAGGGVATPVPRAAPEPVPSTPATASDNAKVSFRLSSQIESDADDSVAVYIYLDGKPLSYVPTSTILLSRDPVLFERELSAGRHVVRVALEQHGERGDGTALHRARFAPEALVFDLEGGRPASLEVEYREGLIEWGAPLSWSFQQGTIRVDRENAGGDSDHWPSLCGEASEPDEERCVTWPSLWEMSDPRQEQTTRDDVLRAMALFDYRPVPIDS